jgi:hypothetical protein
MKKSITDKKLIQEFSKFALQHNKTKANLLAKAIRQSTSIEQKTLYYIDLHFELFQLCEVFEMVLHSLKLLKTKNIPFWKTYIGYNATVKMAQKYLSDAQNYKNKPIDFFKNGLNLDIEKFCTKYAQITNVKITDNFWKNNLDNIIQALTLRAHNMVIRAYNKIKHGFTIPFLSKGTIYICKGIINDDELDLIKLSFKEEEIDRTVGYIKHFTGTIENLLKMALA